MFGPTLLLLTDVGTEVPHYRPRLRFAGNRDGQWKSHAVDHPRLIGSKVGLARNPVYPPCTSVRRFCCFSPYWRFLKSVTYALSITLRGSNPTRPPILKPWRRPPTAKERAMVQRGAQQRCLTLSCDDLGCSPCSCNSLQVLINRSLSLKWPRFEFSPTGLGSVSACLSMSSQRSNFMVTVVSTTEANTSLGR